MQLVEFQATVEAAPAKLLLGVPFDKCLVPLLGR